MRGENTFCLVRLQSKAEAQVNLSLASLGVLVTLKKKHASRAWNRGPAVRVSRPRRSHEPFPGIVNIISAFYVLRLHRKLLQDFGIICNSGPAVLVPEYHCILAPEAGRKKGAVSKHSKDTQEGADRRQLSASGK